jgi:hypothetical protein
MAGSLRIHPCSPVISNDSQFLFVCHDLSALRMQPGRNGQGMGMGNGPPAGTSRTNVEGIYLQSDIQYASGQATGPSHKKFIELNDGLFEVTMPPKLLPVAIFHITHDVDN